jgi:hypothetical protein
MDSGLAPTARPGMTAELANAPLPCCFARRGHRRSLFSFPPMRGMERREAPGAIDGRPLADRYRGPACTPLTEACARLDNAGCATRRSTAASLSETAPPLLFGSRRRRCSSQHGCAECKAVFSSGDNFFSWAILRDAPLRGALRMRFVSGAHNKFSPHPEVRAKRASKDGARKTYSAAFGIVAAAAFAASAAAFFST